LHGDVVAAGCALLMLAPEGREPCLERMLERASAADRYRKRLGRVHPKWGNGSLMAVARSYPHRREPALDDAEYCACLAMVFEALVAWRLRGAALSRGRR